MQKIVLSSLTTLLLLSGCAEKCTQSFNSSPYDIQSHHDVTVIENESRIISNKLFNDYKNLCAEKRIPIVVTSLVSIHDVSETSNFGRTFSELVMSNFAKHNVTVYDYRAKKAISVSDEGEFLLSRDASKIHHTIGESYVFAGSYSVNEKAVIINARLISIQTGQVVSAATTTIRDKNVVKTVCQNGICNVINAEDQGKLIKIIAEDCKDPVACKQK